MKRLAYKKFGIFGLLTFFSLSAFAEGGDPSTGGTDFISMIQKILISDLQPLLHIATTVSYLIGLFFIMFGLTRLYRHGSGAQNMMHRVSPGGTAMYFISGVVLISFMPYLQMISGSIFHLDAQNVLMTQCINPTDIATSGFQTSSNNFCPMLAYSDSIPKDGDATGEAIKFLIFGVMFLVGIISFIRGMVQLVKIGEGAGHGQGVGKALTHIFAGIIAVNADSFYTFMQNILDSHINS